MALTMSCALATSLESHEHARIAEELGFERVWFYDSPALYADVWTQLCRAAERTTTISLGPGVLVPSLRHPMVTASAISQLYSIAGDRVVVGVGTGFTGRLTMGQRPERWDDVAAYVNVVRALLRGERVQWDGATVQMLHYPGYAAPRPIEVPWLFGAQGPKGCAAAKEHASGVLGAPYPVAGFDWSVAMTFGTVLDEGEDPGSERAIAAGGHGAAVQLHMAMEFDQLDNIPGGREWAKLYADAPKDTFHMLMHDGHLVAVNENDRPFITGDVMSATGMALDLAGWRDRIAQMQEAGATELAYQPAGPDIPRELEAFAKLMSN